MVAEVWGLKKLGAERTEDPVCKTVGRLRGGAHIGASAGISEGGGGAAKRELERGLEDAMQRDCPRVCGKRCSQAARGDDGEITRTTLNSGSNVGGASADPLGFPLSREHGPVVAAQNYANIAENPRGVKPTALSLPLEELDEEEHEADDTSTASTPCELRTRSGRPVGGARQIECQEPSARRRCCSEQKKSSIENGACNETKPGAGNIEADMQQSPPRQVGLPQQQNLQMFKASNSINLTDFVNAESYRTTDHECGERQQQRLQPNKSQQQQQQPQDRRHASDSSSNSSDGQEDSASVGSDCPARWMAGVQMELGKQAKSAGMPVCPSTANGELRNSSTQQFRGEYPIASRSAIRIASDSSFSPGNGEESKAPGADPLVEHPVKEYSRKWAGYHRVCVVTGANRGLGLAMVESLMRPADGPMSSWLGPWRKEGFDKIFALVRTPSEASMLEQLSIERPGVIRIVKFNQCSEESMKLAVETIRRETSHVDLLINNAASMTRPTGLRCVRANKLIESLVTNAAGPILFSRLMLPLMRRSRGRRIINISSAAGSIGGCCGGQAKGHYEYKMSKAALNMGTSVMAQEFKHEGILVAAYNPGGVCTDTLKQWLGPRATPDFGWMLPSDAAEKFLRILDYINFEEHTGSFLNHRHLDVDDPEYKTLLKW